MLSDFLIIPASDCNRQSERLESWCATPVPYNAAFCSSAGWAWHSLYVQHRRNCNVTTPGHGHHSSSRAHEVEFLFARCIACWSYSCAILSIQGRGFTLYVSSILGHTCINAKKRNNNQQANTPPKVGLSLLFASICCPDLCCCLEA